MFYNFHCLVFAHILSDLFLSLFYFNAIVNGIAFKMSISLVALIFSLYHCF